MNTVPRSSTARSRWCTGLTRSACLSSYSIADLCRSPKLCEWQKRFREKSKVGALHIYDRYGHSLPQDRDDRNRKIIELVQQAREQ